MWKRLPAEKDCTLNWATLEARDHGLPMSPPRIFMLLYKKQHYDGSFRWPEPLPKPSIEPWLDGSPLPVHELERRRPNALGYAIKYTRISKTKTIGD